MGVNDRHKLMLLGRKWAFYICSVMPSILAVVQLKFNNGVVLKQRSLNFRFNSGDLPLVRHVEDSVSAYCRRDGRVVVKEKHSVISFPVLCPSTIRLYSPFMLILSTIKCVEMSLSVCLPCL